MLVWAGRAMAVVNSMFVWLLMAPLILFYILNIMPLQYQLAYYIPTAFYAGAFLILFWSEPKQQSGIFIVKSIMPFILTIIAGVFAMGTLIFAISTTEWNIVMNCDYAAYNVTSTDQLECTEVNWWWGFATLIYHIGTIVIIFVQEILLGFAALAIHNFLSEGRFIESMAQMNPFMRHIASQAQYFNFVNSRKSSGHKGYGQV